MYELIPVEFETSIHSFGKINKKKQDNRVVFIFKFTNLGEEPLIIKKVDVSCGCISADFSKHPVKKDSIGYIQVTVNPESLSGFFNKSVFVTSNSESEVDLLKVKGTVY